MGKLSKEHSGRGFTLLELSIVLALIGIIVGMGLVTLTASLQASEYNATVAKIDAIDKALLDFSITNYRIPCPADLTQTVSSATYGLEAGAGSGSAIATGTGVCAGTGMLPQANFVATSGAAEGGVPTRALQLTDDYMYDGWGRRFRYAVDPTATKANVLPYPANGQCSASASAITVNDATGAARTTAGIYALISHGANGHGAYTSSDATVNAGSSSTDELINCHCTSAGVYNGTYTPTYVAKAPQYDASHLDSALYYFDDIVTFKEGWQMQAQNFPLAAPLTCQLIFVSNETGNQVQIFTNNGSTFVNGIGSGYNGVSGSEGAQGNGPGQWAGPWGSAVDKNGNIWVADYYNERVQKFSSSYTYLFQLGCASGWCGCGTANGQFCSAEGVATDANNNVWVVDNGHNRVQEFNSSGTWLSTIPPGCPNSGYPACAAGSGNGQFNQPTYIAIDSSGNIWVSDGGNNRVQEFNSGGTYIKQLGCASGTCSGGSAGGQFNYPMGIGTDPSGNVWVADAGNDRVEKFSNSGTYLLTATGGTLYFPYALGVDSSGNVWVTDYGYENVQEWNSSGTYITSFDGSVSPTGAFGKPLGITIGGR